MNVILRSRALSIIGRAQRSRYATSIREPSVVGLNYDPNGRETLISLYNETLDAIKAIPESAAYRKNVTSLTEFRLKVVSETEDIATIESRLGLGQIEEVIEQAQDELDLIPQVIEWQPWREPAGGSNVKIEVVD